MSVFETERPDVTSTSDYKLKVLKETARARRNNLKAVEEGLFKKKEEKKTKKKLDDIDKKEEEKQKKLKLRDKLSKKATKENYNRALLTLERDLVMENKDTVFNVALFNIVYEACWIDDAVKEATMFDMFDHMLETLSVLEACRIPKKPDNALVKNLRESSLRITKEAAARIANSVKESCDEDDDDCDYDDDDDDDDKKCKKGKCDDDFDMDEDDDDDDLNKIDFSLSDTESIDLDSDINDLGKEEIVKLVKDKVLTVVQDEQRSSEEKSKAMEELKKSTEPTATDDSGVTTDDDVADGGEGDAETAGSGITPENGAAEESVSVTEAKFQDMITRIKKEKINRKYASSLFESIMIHAYNNILTEADENEKAVADAEKVIDAADDSNMADMEKAKKAVSEATKNQILGAALQEAVLTYTVLETVNTLGMYDFGPRTVHALRDYYKKIR